MSTVPANIRDLLFQITGLINDVGFNRSKPLIGGVFGSSGFVIASTPVIRHGLNDAMYAVLEQSSGLALGAAATKQGAIAGAREMIGRVGLAHLKEICEAYRTEKLEQARAKAKAAEEEQRQILLNAEKTHKVKSIPRRRRQIFEESEGKCHYCATPLTLDGRWHVEHKMPKALGGGNEPGNLVASCAPCNHKKLDRTDVEFIAMKKAGLA